MTGKPAARQTDMTEYGGEIVQGSLTVRIGSQGGIACSSCPGGQAVGSPVNPQLGAKVLLGEEELDFALPGPAPLVWQRQYSSYVNAEHGAACTLLGHGWHLLTEVTLELRPASILVHDAAGRTITFDEALAPGEEQYSASEDFWLLRGGQDSEGNPPRWSHQPRFAHISPEWAGDSNCIISTSGSADAFWVFTPMPAAAKSAAGKKEKAPGKPLGQRWRLTAQIDRYGRSQRYEYSTGRQSQRRNLPQTLSQSLHELLQDDTPLPAGRLLTLTDGVGRRYRLTHQRIHSGKAAQGLWGADDGWRLAAVTLERDPLHKLPEPIVLVRYGYNRQGQLTQVHDRAGELVREFEWTRRRISAHRYRGGPWHRYQYGGTEPNVKVIAHTNEEGLDYQFQYKRERPSPEGKPRHSATVTDSLKRVNIYRYEGAAGLSRLIEHQRADGSTMRYRYDGHGRLTATTDPLERTTTIRRDGQGNVLGVQQPDGAYTRQNYDATGYLIESQGPDGAITRYQYDEYKRLILTTWPDGGIERRHYPDPKEQPLVCDNATRIEDPKGGIQHVTYNETGQPSSYTDCSDKTTRWDYDRWGEVIRITDAQDHTTRYSRDSAGRITATHLPNGQTQRYQYDRQGNPIRIELDENNPASAQEIGRDLWGRPIRITQGGLSLQLEWDVAGRLKRITNENGAQSWFIRDEMDRLVQEVGFDGRTKRYGYNPAGQLEITGDGAGDDKDLVTRYRYDLLGRLIEWHISGNTPGLPPGAHPSNPPPNHLGSAPAQIHRYTWDAANRLKAVSVHLPASGEQQGAEEQLQSHVEMAYDPLGRLTGEIQRLYGAPAQPGQTPPIEYEHRISHKLDPLGNRLASALQNIGELQWLCYGSGHVHGLMLGGQNLIDFERDALHRETKRTLHTASQEQALQITRWRDSLGRLEDIRLHNLPTHKHNAIPRPLVGQIERRQYHYDALNQLTAVEMPHQTLGFGYDAAGRLREQARYDPKQYLQTPGKPQPQQAQRWEIDPAGNRLPSQLDGERRERQYSAELVYNDWKNPYASALGRSDQPRQLEQWPDNRIGYHEDHAWRYDPRGNRVQQLSLLPDHNEQYPGQNLGYDGANQLIAVEMETRVGRGQVVARAESRYLYDGLGRRLKKTVTGADGQKHITYFGWDGDRHVHTEILKDDGTREIVHTVYEPGSFTPLLRLSATATGAPQAQPHLFVQASQAGAPAGKQNDPGTLQALAMMQGMLAGLPEAMQKNMEQGIGQVIEQGLPPQMQAVMGEMGQKTNARLAAIRQALQDAKRQGQTPVTVHYFHCDHLGTPLALTDQEGKIIWAARLDPWGSLEEEYNPHGIEQNIRLPGQYHDRETGLYYNRHRYYDFKIGAYINQDPIGLKGGANLSTYVSSNPLKFIDPRGLFGDGQAYGEQYPGHGDFYCSNVFDYTAYDHGWTSPYISPSGHFRPLPDVERDLQAALNSCDYQRFRDLMHQGQDHWSHYRNGYRWDPNNSNLPCNGWGHACVGTTPDEDVGAWNLAENWTVQWADKWMAKCNKTKYTCTFRR